MWKLVKDYFVFTRKDRVGMLVMLVLMLGVILLPGWMQKHAEMPVAVNDSSFIAIRNIEKPTEEPNTIRNPYGNSPALQTAASLFYFDPNRIDATGWTKLGIREKTIQTILNYLAKGGKFRRPEDLQKIYGLRPADYERLNPYIRIVEPFDMDKKSQLAVIQKSYSEPYHESFSNDTKPAFVKYEKHYAVVDINNSDTTAWIALPGIGSKLAARIVSFRNKLGGFYSIDQVAETFGLPDSVFKRLKVYLKLENIVLRKININSASPEEFKSHPYIRWNLGQAIIAYRNAHGKFNNPEELKNIMSLTDEIYNKLVPYLEL
jgi:competence protein ComEA